MALSGRWRTQAVRDYTGATKWGNGVDPIHASHDAGRGRVIGTRENLYPLGEPSDVVDDRLTALDIDYVCEDYVDSAPLGESYRYQDERPRWNEQTPQFRGETTSAAMGEQPAWGPYFDNNPVDGFPLGGPTGGSSVWLDVSHGENAERQHAIAVPTPGVSGGWKAKQRNGLALAESQDPGDPGYQLAINTSARQGQGVQSLDNERAVARGTDDPRSGIQSRTAGMVVKFYGQSINMGGGPGSPDMTPRQLTADLRRPFRGRLAATPPEEVHTMNTMEGRSPINRSLPPDPYQGDSEVGAGDMVVSDWGF